MRWLGIAVMTALAGLASTPGCDDGGDADADGDADGDADVDVDGDGDGDADGDADGDGDGDGDGDSDVCLAGDPDVDGDGVCRSADCDDESAAVSPGRDEVCGNGLDDDCDGSADDGCLTGTTSFYVDRDSLGGACSDSNPGTQAAPWCTIAQANAALGPGDTVYLRAGTYAGETIEPAGSGASETERITYAAFENETVTLTASVYCIRLQAKAYVTIVGLHFVDCERNLYVEASNHVNVGSCEFANPGGPVTWAGARIYAGSQHNRIHDCTFSRYGNENEE